MQGYQNHIHSFPLGGGNDDDMLCKAICQSLQRLFAEPPWTKESPPWQMIDDKLPHNDAARLLVAAVENGSTFNRCLESYSPGGTDALRPDLCENRVDRGLVGSATSEPVVQGYTEGHGASVGRDGHLSVTILVVQLPRPSGLAHRTRGFGKCCKLPRGGHHARRGGVRWMVPL